MTITFLIVLPFFKNSYRPASDMTFLTDIYIKVKTTEHKWGIRCFVICTKAGWCYRLEGCSEIQTMNLYSKLILLTLEFYGHFLWMGFNCLMARATSRRQFTFYHHWVLEIPGTHFSDLGRMKGWVDLGATQWFCVRFWKNLFPKYSQKSEKFNSRLWIYILLLVTHTI